MGSESEQESTQGRSPSSEFLGRTASRALPRFIPAATVLCLLIYAFTYLDNVFGPPVRSDGAGYFAYLPALVIERDPSYERLADEAYGGAIPAWTGIRRYPPTGRYVDTYNMGCAVLALPFYLVAHVVTLIAGFPYDAARAEFPYHFVYPANGLSFFYLHAAGLAGVCYGLLGLVLLRRLMLRLYSPAVVLTTLVALLIGTNLLNYISAESFSSHAMLFFLFAAWLNAVSAWYARPASWRGAIILGALAGLLPLVRTPAFMLWCFFPLYGLRSFAQVPNRLGLWWTYRFRLVLAAAVALLVFLPQMMMWHYGTGHWIANSYAALYPEYQLTHFGAPKFGAVLFSLRGGLLFWSPVLLFALAGFVWLRRDAPDLVLPLLLTLVATTYLIASWHDWAFGGGFGHRGFVEYLVLLAFPLASLYQRAFRGPPLVRWLTVAVTLACAGYELFFMMLYYTRELSLYGLDRQALFDIFWWRIKALAH